MGIARATWFWNNTAGSYAVNTATISYDDGLFPNAMAEELCDFMGDVWQSNIPTTWTLQRVEVANDTIFGSGGTPRTGTQSQDVETPNTAYVVTKVGGPRKRYGRWFIPGVSTNRTTPDGQVDPGLVTAINSSYVTRLAALETFGILLFNSSAPLALGNKVDELILTPKVGSQRRRLRR